jgi:DNA polymerase III delta prime subunit
MTISFFEEKPNLHELDFKLDILHKFSILHIDEINNLLFYGPKGSGKSIKIYAFLASLFDKKIYEIKNMCHEAEKKQMNYKSSIYHIEIDIEVLGSNERLFIHSFIKPYIETRNIGLDIPKIIVMKNADLLSNLSQMMLRRLIEKNYSSVRFFFEANSLSKLSSPIISRFLLIRIKTPSDESIKVALNNFISRNCKELYEDTLTKNNAIEYILSESNKIDNKQNLKKIFGFLRYYIATKKHFHFLYYDKFEELFDFILQKKISFVNFQKIRDIIHELYINNVASSEILNYLFQKITNHKLYKSNNDFIEAALEITITCDINLKKGNKECLHIESYIISIIDLIHTKNL